jgi:hypothetical protein
MKEGLWIGTHLKVIDIHGSHLLTESGASRPEAACLRDSDEETPSKAVGWLEAFDFYVKLLPVVLRVGRERIELVFFLIGLDGIAGGTSIAEWVDVLLSPIRYWGAAMKTERTMAETSKQHSKTHTSPLVWAARADACP